MIYCPLFNWHTGIQFLRWFSNKNLLILKTLFQDFSIFLKFHARLLSLLSARRSVFMPKIMRVWNGKLYLYRVTDKWYWVRIYLYFSGDNRAIRAHKLYSFYITIYTLRAYRILLLHLGNLHVNMRVEDLLHARQT